MLPAARSSSALLAASALDRHDAAGAALLRMLALDVPLDDAAVRAALATVAARAVDAAGDAVRAAEPHHSDARPHAPADVRAQQMARLTEAFGEELDRLRQEDGFDASRLPLLVDVLETSLTTLSAQVPPELLLPSSSAPGPGPVQTGRLLV